MNLLIKSGAVPNAKGRMGRSPLHWALHEYLMTRVLLKHGADASLQDESGDTPLHLAVQDHGNLIQYILTAGSNVNCTNLEGLSPFHLLLDQKRNQGNQYVSISAFIASGADTESPFPDGRSPLTVFLQRVDKVHLTSVRQRQHFNEALLAFLREGADIYTGVVFEECFLSYYFRKIFRSFDLETWDSDLEVVTTLCQSSSPIWSDPNGNTLLHLAMSTNTRTNGTVCNGMRASTIFRIVKIALDIGVDPDSRNRSHQVPMLLLMRSALPTSLITRILTKLLQEGADATLMDASQICPLYEGAKLLPAKELAGMLRVTTEREQVQNELTVGGMSVWSAWYRALQCTVWDDARDIILQDEIPIGRRETSRVKQAAISVLVEKFLKRARNMFDREKDAVAKRRHYVAEILSDCRKRGLADVTHFDYLLELCL